MDAMYGVAPVYHKPNLHPLEFRSAVHIQDRVPNFEAMIVGFLAENSLSFSQVGKESLYVLF